MKFKKPLKNLRPLIPAAVISVSLPVTAIAEVKKDEADPTQWQEAKQSLAEAGEHASNATANAWLDGKLEATLLLNRHLNNFKIDTSVKGDTAYLSGTVRSDIDRDLAGQVALNVKGIEKVENDLKVDADAKLRSDEESERNFGQRIEDATTTAIVKTKLLTHDNIEGMAVNVDTYDSVVTLSGTVASKKVRNLVEIVVSNTDAVESVVNELQVDS